jgi:protein TonB
MTTYAPVPAYADHKFHPRVLLLIAAGHAALITAVLMIKTDLPRRLIRDTITIEPIPAPKPPPPHLIQTPQKTQPERQVRQTIDHEQQVEQTQLHTGPVVDNTVVVPNVTPVDPHPFIPVGPAQTVRTGPRFATPQSELKPPYPEQKQLAGEEATLRLKLMIDAEGRVTAVDPVGSADPVFLAAARKHILAHWRYQPATEDGHPVPSSTVITLQFQLDG